MPNAMILDTDACSDIDDLYALALAARHPGLDLLGVTTVAGDTTTRARLCAKLLRLMDRTDVPVRAGLQVRLAALDAGDGDADYRQNLTHAGLIHDDDPEREATYPDGVAFILNALAEAAHPITLVAIGPWTNIAEVIRRADAKQRDNIGCIALMGGEVHLMRREANACNDPEATHVVLTSGLPIFMGTWSVTRRLNFTMAEVDQLMADSDKPHVQALHEGTHLWWGPGKKVKDGPVLYDVIPVFWAAGERDSITCIRLDKVDVELTGTYTRGMTVSDPWRIMQAAQVHETSADYLAVSHDLDVAALKQRYIGLML